MLDDGSTDDTAELARSFAGRLPRLQVISTANGGIGHARNAAIAASSAPIIAPLDADDIWHPSYLEKMAGELTAHPGYAFVYCFYRLIDMQSVVITSQATYALRGCGFYQMLARNVAATGSNAVFWRRRFDETGGYEPSLQGVEDGFMLLLLAWRAPICVVPEYLVGYRNTPGSVGKSWRRMTGAGLRMCDLLEARLPTMRRQDMRWSRGRRQLAIADNMRRHNDGTAIGVLWHSLLGFWYSPRRSLLAELRRHGQWLPPAKKRRRPRLRGQPFASIDPQTDGRVPLRPEVASSLRAGRKHDEAHAAIQREFAAVDGEWVP